MAVATAILAIHAQKSLFTLTASLTPNVHQQAPALTLVPNTYIHNGSSENDSFVFHVPNLT